MIKVKPCGAGEGGVQGAGGGRGQEGLHEALCGHKLDTSSGGVCHK